MSGPRIPSLIVMVIRWSARVWSLLIAAVALWLVVGSPQQPTEPVPFGDWVLVGFYGVAVVGLLLAWRWEALGGIIAVVSVALHPAASYVIRGAWNVQLLPWFILGLPGILFLLSWGLSRALRKSAGPWDGESVQR